MLIKKILTYILTLLFVFQSTSSFWIMASFYINQDYIVKNICVNRFDKVPVCNGHCYLAKKLKDNEKKDQKLPNSTKEKEVVLYCQAQTVSSVCLNFFEEFPNKLIVHQIALFPKAIPYSIFHPPRTV